MARQPLTPIRLAKCPVDTVPRRRARRPSRAGVYLDGRVSRGVGRWTWIYRVLTLFFFPPSGPYLALIARGRRLTCPLTLVLVPTHERWRAKRLGSQALPVPSV